MKLPTERQWARYSALCTCLRHLAAPEQAAALQALRTAGEEEPQVLSLVAIHLALPPDPDRVRTGERLGNFTLEEPLGAGGMGVVYRAQQHIGPATRSVAVKLIHPAFLRVARDEAMARFLAELHTLATLQHEHIARIYDGGIYDDPRTHEPLPFMAMELVHGGLPITTYAREYGLTWPERLALFLRVCRALQYAHEHRVVHRDLKPANLLVDQDGRPFVIDFGLAHVCDAVLSGAHLAASGTPAYMSPEQVSEAFGAISEKSDVYALGLILFELLTEQPPYGLPHDGSFEQLCQAITEVTPPPLHHFNIAYSGELEASLSLALAKRPADRISVAVLRCRIERYLNTLQPDSVRPPKSTAPLSTRERQQHLRPVPVQSEVTGPLAPSLPHAGRMLIPHETPLLWLRSVCGGPRLLLVVVLLLCLAGAATTVMLWEQQLSETAVSQMGLAPVVSSPALAYQALEQGDSVRAESLFQRLAGQSELRGQSQGYAGLAASALARGEAKQALEFAAQAELLDPEIVYSHVIRGHILWDQGKPGAAKTAYRIAAEKTNGLPWQQAIAADRLGRIYATEGFTGTALQYYDRAISQYPNMTSAYVNKAHLLAQMGRHEEAMGLYHQALQIDPDDRFALVLLRQAERQQHFSQDRQQQVYLAQRVAALLRAHAEGRPPENGEDAWTSAPLTLAFLGVQRFGPPAPQAGVEEFLWHGTAQTLQASGRLQILDHTLLEMLMTELQRSATELLDPQVALHIGSILAVRLLATGSIVRSGVAETLRVSLIETATGAVQTRAEVTWPPSPLPGAVEQLSHTLLQQVRQLYPLRGRIIQSSLQGVVLNIGSDQGVIPGLSMQVFGSAEQGELGHHVGQIEVTVVEAQRSQARVLEHTEVLQQAWKVQEVARE